MRGKLDFSFVQEILEEKLRLRPDEKRGQNPKIQLEIYERMKFSSDLPLHFKKLMEIEHRGYITVNAIAADFKLLNKNIAILLDTSDFIFMKRFLSLRNIPRLEDVNSNTLVRSAITDLAEILNIDFAALEMLILLLTSNKEDKIFPLFQQLNMERVDPTMQGEKLQSFISYICNVCQTLESRLTNIENINKNIFSDNLPIVMCNKILFSK